jgi:glucarate dehydratase
MDARARGPEGLAGHELRDTAWAADHECLVASAAVENVDADAGAAMVVEARVTRLPPHVEPGFGVRGSPQEIEVPLAVALERSRVDELRRGPRDVGALLGREIAIGQRERLESSGIDHGLILNRTRGTVQNAAMSRIAQVEAWPANARLEAPYLMAPGEVPGISRTIVRVTTEDGIVGLGESASPSDAALISAELGPSLVGRDWADVLAELTPAGLPQPEHRSDGKVLIRNAPAGIEIALWDIAGREAGVPLHELLGGARRSHIAFSEYFAYRPGLEDSPAAVAAYCARMVEEHDSPVFEGKVAVRTVEDDVQLAREVRAAIGPDRALRLDANMGWRLETAQRALRLLEPFDIANVEEPVARFAEMAELRRSAAIPFSAHTPDVALAARLGVPDALVIGLAPCGGIAGTRQLIAACEKAGVGFWFYSGDFGIATAAYLHIAAATPYLDRPSQSLLRWTGGDVIAGGPFSPEGGFLEVPDGPGLGVDLDERALARCVDRYAHDGEYDFYAGGPLPRY